MRWTRRLLWNVGVGRGGQVQGSDLSHPQSTLPPTSPRTYLPDHSFHPAPPLLRNRAFCAIFGHHHALFAFNHYTLQADLLCLRCSRYTPFSLATLWPENLDEQRTRPGNHPASTTPLGDRHGDDEVEDDIHHIPIPTPDELWDTFWTPPDLSDQTADQH